MFRTAFSGNQAARRRLNGCRAHTQLPFFTLVAEVSFFKPATFIMGADSDEGEQPGRRPSLEERIRSNMVRSALRRETLRLARAERRRQRKPRVEIPQESVVEEVRSYVLGTPKQRRARTHKRVDVTTSVLCVCGLVCMPRCAGKPSLSERVDSVAV